MRNVVESLSGKGDFFSSFTLSKKVFPSPSARLAIAIMMSAASTGVWANGGSFTGQVVGVTDGDTITVLDSSNHQHTVRLAYIDAPETTCHAKKPGTFDDRCVDQGQPFARAAKKALSNLVYKSPVSVSVLPGSSYGREIGAVTTMRNGHEINVNFEMVKSGMAWFYRHYARDQMNEAEYTLFNEAEYSAMKRKSGLWSQQYPTPPWRYRRENHAEDVFGAPASTSARQSIGKYNFYDDTVSPVAEQIVDKAKSLTDSTKIFLAGISTKLSATQGQRPGY